MVYTIGKGRHGDDARARGAVKSTNPRVIRRMPLQLIRDRAIVSELYMKGKTIVEIVEIMKAQFNEDMSIGMIRKDLKFMQENWQNSALMDTDTAMSRELARLDQLERTYWQAWENSLKQRSISTAEKTEDKTGAAETHAYSRTKTKRVSAERDGNVLFLQGIERVIAQRAKLLGLNAPQRYEINWRKEAEKYNIDPDVMKDSLVNEFVEAARRGATTRPPVSEKIINKQLENDADEFTE